MKTLIRYGRIYLTVLKSSIMMMLAYRADFFMWTFVHAFELTINATFFNIIFLHTSAIGGWNIYQVLILLGFMELTLGLGGVTFYPMMYGFGRMIRRGELDWKLVKPVDAQFLATIPWLDVSDMASIPSGILVMSYGLLHLGFQNLFLNIGLFVASLFLAMVIMYSAIVLLLSLAFKTTNIDYIHYFYWNIQWLGRYPVTVFKGITHFIFMFVVPIGLIATVPAQTLAGTFNWSYLGIAFVYAVGLFWLSRKVFTRSLRLYSSASS
ncbi:ABC-2 family transporter protein [Patescibacteria group bacterium]|nr:ABC-2 family transporter protein [Patescibacteria group bacterium]